MSGAVGRRPSVVSRQYPDEIRDGGSQSCGNTSRHASVRSESLASDILFVALSLDNSKYVQDQSCWAPPRRQLVPLIVAGVYGDVVILTARTGMAWSTTARGRGLGQQHHLGSVSQTPTFVYAFMLSTSQDKEMTPSPTRDNRRRRRRQDHVPTVQRPDLLVISWYVDGRGARYR